MIVLNATGYIVAAHKIELAAKVIGRVSWVGVEMGDKVKKGQPLVRLEDDEYRARLLQEQGQFEAARARLAELVTGSRPQEIQRAKADLDEATAEMQNANVSVQRDRELANTKAISQQTIDDAEAKYDGAVAKLNSLKATYELAKVGTRQEEIDAQRGQVEQMQGMLDLAKVDLANTVIYAPTDGTILERNVEVGEFVTTGFVGDRGAKGYVVSLADLNDLRVELDIAQSDFRNVSVGQKCSVTTDAYPDRKYEGKVDLVAPQANRQKATVLAKVKILNPDGLLRPEMNASVAFFASGAGPSTVRAGVWIPVSAVHGHTVFVVESSKAVERTVEIGADHVEGNLRSRCERWRNGDRLPAGFASSGASCPCARINRRLQLDLRLTLSQVGWARPTNFLAAGRSPSFILLARKEVGRAHPRSHARISSLLPSGRDFFLHPRHL